MKKFSRNFCSILIGLVLLLFVFQATGLAQAQKSELEKKYAAIIGEYEFDLTEMGMGVVVVSIFCDADAIYAQPDVSDTPGEMQPVEGKEFEFTIEDDEGGTYTLKFSKDESGKYTKCHVVNELMGMDSVGTKIEK